MAPVSSNGMGDQQRQRLFWAEYNLPVYSGDAYGRDRPGPGLRGGTPRPGILAPDRPGP